jgi:hypothetical protein
MWKILKCFFSPLRTLSILLIVLATLDHLYNPFMHISEDTNLAETIIRAIFLFSGIFGLLGNGKHLQVRAVIVGYPYIYLAVVYLLKFVDTGVQAIIIPFVFTLLIGLWTIIFGAYNEHRTTSIFDCFSNSNFTKPDN